LRSWTKRRESRRGHIDLAIGHGNFNLRLAHEKNELVLYGARRLGIACSPAGRQYAAKAIG